MADLPPLPPGPIEAAFLAKSKSAPGDGRIGANHAMTFDEHKAILAERRAAQSEWLRANEDPYRKKIREREEAFQAKLSEHNRLYKEQEDRKEAARQAEHDQQVAEARAWEAQLDKRAEDERLLAAFRESKTKGGGKM